MLSVQDGGRIQEMAGQPRQQGANTGGSRANFGRQESSAGPLGAAHKELPLLPEGAAPDMALRVCQKLVQKCCESVVPPGRPSLSPDALMSLQYITFY